MPRALCIETSGRTGSIALSEEDGVLVQESFSHGLQNAAKILPIIDQLCRTASWRPSDLHEIYLSAGPGSFTGLRIGVTIAKTLALSLGAKIVAVPSVNVLVENAPADARNVIIVLDAKRGQIFTARFARDVRGEWNGVEEAHLDDLRSMLSRSPRPVHLLGEGIPFHRDAIAGDVIITDESAWIARASVVARLGRAMSLRGEFADPDRLIPIYIRLPEAEEKWLASR